MKVDLLKVKMLLSLVLIDCCRLYSRTSLIHTPINLLLGLSGLRGDSKMATLSSEKSNSRKRKRVVLTLEDLITVFDHLKDGAT